MISLPAAMMMAMIAAVVGSMRDLLCVQPRDSFLGIRSALPRQVHR